MLPAGIEAFLEAMAHAAEAAYPQESCGLLLSSPEGERLTRHVACRNAQDALHTQDPAAYPRTSRQAFFIEPRDLLHVHREIRETGEKIRVICHSHPDSGAFFSGEDRRMALGGGADPLWPGVDYLVISVREGKACEARNYAWDPSEGEFLETGKWEFPP